MTAFVWDNTSNVWNSDHWGRGGTAPVFPGDLGSSAADTISIPGYAPPASGPAEPLTVASYACNNNSFAENANITIAPGGAILLGTGDYADQTGPAQWYGDASQATTCTLLSNTDNYGKIGGNSTWGAANNFNQTDWYNWPGATVGDHAVFYGGDTAQNSGTVGDYATFVSSNDFSLLAINDGVVGDHATFTGRSFSGGDNPATVGDYAVFTDISQNYAGSVGNFAIFSGLALNRGTAGANAIITSAAVQTGTFGGGLLDLSFRETVAVIDSTNNGSRVNVYGLVPTILSARTSDGKNTDILGWVLVTAEADAAANTAYGYTVSYDVVKYGAAVIKLDCDPNGNLKAGGGTLIDGDRYKRIDTGAVAPLFQAAYAAAIAAWSAPPTPRSRPPPPPFWTADFPTPPMWPRSRTLHCEMACCWVWRSQETPVSPGRIAAPA